MAVFSYSPSTSQPLRYSSPRKHFNLEGARREVDVLGLIGELLT